MNAFAGGLSGAGLMAVYSYFIKARFGGGASMVDGSISKIQRHLRIGKTGRWGSKAANSDLSAA